MSTSIPPATERDRGVARAASAGGRRLVRGLVAIPALPLIVAATAWARAAGVRRRRRGSRPRLIWGPEPIISIKYWSAALRARGYTSVTLVWWHYPIHQRSDFDRYADGFLPRGAAFDPLRGYAVFVWALATADIYMSFFDGGFLRGTALRRLELPLWRLAGKAIIVSPYGTDIAVPGHLDVAEERLLRDYPQIAVHDRQVQRRVLQFSRWANLIVRNLQFGFLPRWEVVWPTMVAVDTDEWQPQKEPSRHDGSSGEVVVVHAPNHRAVKGTDALIAAVERLRSEGLRVRLELLERRPNHEVREAVQRADIVAEQFIAGYGLFAIEGMAAGAPVVSALGWLADDLRENLERRGCPLLDSDPDRLAGDLRRLVTDPDLRRATGEASRRFALAQHSYEAVGRSWEAIIGHVWNGEPLPEELLPARAAGDALSGAGQTGVRGAGQP